MKTTFPTNPGRALKKAEILIELEAESSRHNGAFADAIRHGITKPGPKDDLLEMIRFQAATSYWDVADVIGYKLLDKIIAFK